MAHQNYVVPQEKEGTRLDIFLTQEIGESRSQVQKMVSQKRILINGELPKKAGHKLSSGDKIEVLEKESHGPVELPEITVISETGHYVIVEKPAGLLVHPTEAKEPVTLAACLLKQFPEIAGVGESEVRPGIVHRLDREASGLLVIAKTQEMFDHLKQQFKDRTVDKEYYVLVYGTFDTDHDTIDFVIDRGNDGRMVARPKTDLLKLKNATKTIQGKDAITEYWVKQAFVRFSFLRIKIHTGRMHQIRVHMFATGHPVVGDTLYENKKLIKKGDSDIGRLFLHAYKLGFTDLSGEEKNFQIGLPDNLQNHLDLLQ